MKKSDLKHVKENYTKFRAMLFNNDLPSADEIDFTLHQREHALGYAMKTQKPRKSGNDYVIAFGRRYLFSENDIIGILVHEMIHIWQMYHVKTERYTVCTHGIAHDRVFRCKMASINLILKRNLYDVEISTTYSGELVDDPSFNNTKNKSIITL